MADLMGEAEATGRCRYVGAQGEALLGPTVKKRRCADAAPGWLTVVVV